MDAQIKVVRWCATPSEFNPNPQPETHTYIRIPATGVWILVQVIRDADD